jgi:phosphoribosylaminoimidazole-succinocarboxamide synthase
MANVILDGEKHETISSKIRNEARVSTLFFTLTQHSAGIPSQSNKTGEISTRDSNREGRSQIVPVC